MNRLPAVCLFIYLVLAVARAAEPVPVAAFAAKPDFRTLKLTPNGKEIGILGHRDHADYWFLIDVQTMQPMPGPGFTNLRVENFWWKGEDQVLFLLTEFTGNSYFQVYDRKKKVFRDFRTFSGNTDTIENPLINDPEHMLVSTATKSGVDLRKLNIRSGKLETVESNPGSVYRWLTDRSGRALAGFGREGDTWFVLTRGSDERKWTRTSLGTQSQPDFRPMAVFSDQRRILGHDNRTADTAGMVAWDPATGAKELLFRSEAVDPANNRVWGDDETRVRAIAYETDRPRFVYLDPADDALAKSIDQALPDTINSIVSTSGDENLLIIQAQSDTVPERYFLLDRKNGKLVSLGGARANLSDAQMVPTRFLSFPARDGLPLTARLHLPVANKGLPPLIVLAGADLSSRYSRIFEPYMQLLASRGYAILGVNHRGIDGFGRKFASAGEFQVDGNMTNDLADAVQYIVSQGLVDGSRVAILGQDEGGVLALHTLVRHQSLFRAWLNFETPMDRDAVAIESLAFGLRELETNGLKFSDEVKFRKYREKINPALQLKAVTVPSFHYYSTYQHNRSGYRVQQAMKKSSLPGTYVVSPLPPRNQDLTVEILARRQHDETVRCYTELLKFLDEYLAPSAAR